MRKTIKSPDVTDLAVGQKIRSQRVTNGISQTELADKLGLTFQQVQKYEKGSNRVSAGRLKQIADVFKIPISFFFDGVSGKDVGAEHVNMGLSFLDTAASVRLVRAFADIEDAHVRRDLVALVEELARNHKAKRKKGI